MGSVQLQTVFYLHMCFFQLMGMCPTPVRNRSDRQRDIALLLHSVVQLCCIIVQIVVIIYIHEWIFFAQDTFGRFNDMFKYFGAMVACFTITMESLVKRQQHAQFWTRLYAITVDYAHQSRSLGNTQDARIPLRRQYYVLFYGYWAVVLLVELSIFPVIMRDKHSFNFWAIYLVSLMMSRARHLQYIMYVDTLDMQVANLQTELEKVVEYSKLRRLAAGDPFNDSVLKFICKNVKWSQRYYTMLYEMSLNVNDAFGWSQLANFFHSFVQLLADLYWIYWRFYNQFAYFFVGA